MEWGIYALKCKHIIWFIQTCNFNIEQEAEEA